MLFRSPPSPPHDRRDRPPHAAAGPVEHRRLDRGGSGARHVARRLTGARGGLTTACGPPEARAPVGTLQTTAFATASGTPPHPRRHPDESQDPEPSSAAFGILGPDFRQDDGVGGEAFRLHSPTLPSGGRSYGACERQGPQTAASPSRPPVRHQASGLRPQASGLRRRATCRAPDRPASTRRCSSGRAAASGGRSPRSSGGPGGCGLRGS